MLRYLKNVVALSLDPELCNGCGFCIDVCPHAVLERDSRKVAIVEKDACMECGACSLNCPTGAIRTRVGTGCATALINAALGRTSSECCCSAGGEQNRCDTSSKN